MRAWDARLAAENGKLAQADAASRNAGIKMNEAMGESQAKAAKMQNEASKALEVAERARGQWEAFTQAFDGAPNLGGMLRPEMVKPSPARPPPPPSFSTPREPDNSRENLRRVTHTRPPLPRPPRALAARFSRAKAFLNYAFATPDAAALRAFADEEFCPMARMEGGQLRELLRGYAVSIERLDYSKYGELARAVWTVHDKLADGTADELASISLDSYAADRPLVRLEGEEPRDAGGPSAPALALGALGGGGRGGPDLSEYMADEMRWGSNAERARARRRSSLAGEEARTPSPPETVSQVEYVRAQDRLGLPGRRHVPQEGRHLQDEAGPRHGDEQEGAREAGGAVAPDA